MCRYAAIDTSCSVPRIIVENGTATELPHFKSAIPTGVTLCEPRATYRMSWSRRCRQEENRDRLDRLLALVQWFARSISANPAIQESGRQQRFPGFVRPSHTWSHLPDCILLLTSSTYHPIQKRQSVNHSVTKTPGPQTLAANFAFAHPSSVTAAY